MNALHVEHCSTNTFSRFREFKERFPTRHCHGGLDTRISVSPRQFLINQNIEVQKLGSSYKCIGRQAGRL